MYNFFLNSAGNTRTAGYVDTVQCRRTHFRRTHFLSPERLLRTLFPAEAVYGQTRLAVYGFLRLPCYNGLTNALICSLK